MAKADARARGAKAAKGAAPTASANTGTNAGTAKSTGTANPTRDGAPHVERTATRAVSGATRRDGRGGPLVVPRWLPAVSLALVLIGLALSVYLTYEHYSSSTTLACSDNGVVNCLQVTTSAQSKVFGIPVALLGLIYFAAMVPACLPAAWRSRATWLRYGRIGAGAVGIAFVFYLLYSELFTIGKICLYCTGVHVVTVLLFAVILFGQASVTAPERR